MNKSIDAALENYKTTGEGFDALFTQVVVRVYDYPKRTGLCSEEDCADFLLSFYPRIRAIILRYRDVGRKFDAYLSSCLKWHMKSYLGLRTRKIKKERVLLQEGCAFCSTPDEETVTGEEESPYEGGRPSRIGPFRFSAENGGLHRRSVRRFLLLALKCADELDEPAVRHLSALTGYSRDLFFHLIEALRICMRRRTERIAVLTERRTRNYFRIRLLTEERRTCVNGEQAARLDRRIAKERERYRNSGELLSRVPRNPSHRDIARILGLPKGTVDSGFHYLKKFL